MTFYSQRKASALVVRLAVISIMLAVATMEIALSFVQGFETEIQKKVVGFGSHIQIGNYFQELDKETVPLDLNEPAIDSIRAMEFVSAVSPVVQVWSVCKSATGWDGVWLKGVDSTYDWTFFQTVLKEGVVPDFGENGDRKGILISRKQARRLNLSVGDKAILLFLGETLRRRQVLVQGIYETGMEEFDTNIIICDMRLLQRIRKWDADEVSGFEVNLTSLDMIEPAAFLIGEELPYTYGLEPITYLFPEIFDWLDLQHQNVWVILILMIIVAVINMTSVMLILIIERTRTVGILKAVGLPNHRVRRMFVWYAFFLITIGIIAGNLLGLGLLASQDYFGWLRVNQEDYFIEMVPVAWVWGRFLLINLGVILICTFTMLIPTLIVNRITPLKAIRFE